MSVPIRSRVVLMAAFLLIAAGVHPAAAGSADSSNFTIDLRQAVALEISPINSPQVAGTAFPVTISAKDNSGGIVRYDGTVTVRTAVGEVNPARVWLSGGSLTVWVTLDTPGDAVVLSAFAPGILSAVSNAFPVTGGACAASSVSVGVVEHIGTPVAGATVHLSNGSSCVTDDTYGVCSVFPVPPGTYTAWAELEAGPSDAVSISVACNPVTATIVLRGSACNPQGLTPVLLVPGIMGSTTATWSIYPHLTIDPRNDWPAWSRLDSGGLLDPLGIAGWRSLVNAFKSVNPSYEIGCTLFPTPYDWRLDAREAAEEYLIPQIARAKSIAGSGRVNVVAHSMGGIVTRAYIQGDAFPQPSDIDKFIMVGTPNHGSAMAYFLWEGGDVMLADLVAANVSGSVVSWALDFYRNTAERLYRTHFGERLTSSDYLRNPDGYRLKMLNLVRLDGGHGYVPALRQLLPTSEDKFLVASEPRSLHCQPNTRLDGLNSQPDVGRLGTMEESDPDLVRTAILSGTGQKTLDSIEVQTDRAACAATFYPDGRPRAEVPLTGVTWTTTNSGDGTVKVDSSNIGSIQIAEGDRGPHSGLVGAYRDEIVHQITGLWPTKMNQLKDALEEVRLVIAVDGRVQPLVTDPNLLSAGVVPDTGILVTEIPGSALDLKVAAARVVIEDPATGSFNVDLSGAYAEDCVVSIEFLDETGAIAREESAYFNGTNFNFSFSFDPDSEAKVMIDQSPAVPANVIADDSAGLTDLSWDASLDPAVVGYTIYSKVEGEASLHPVGTAAGLSFATSHPWAASDVTPTRLYAVAAFDAAGKESFLSRPVRNNDRDHDGRTDQEEMDRGTDPSNPDTDSDGLTDGEEAYYGTDPFDDDSDGDGFSDDVEVRGGTDPLDAASTPLIFSDGFEVGSWAEWSSAVQ